MSEKWILSVVLAVVLVLVLGSAFIFEDDDEVVPTARLFRTRP